MLSWVRAMFRRIDGILRRPNVAAMLQSDSILVTAPEAGTVWRVGTEVTVSWRVIGPMGHPVDVVLLRGTGAGIEDVAVLAGEVPTRQLSVRVRVPEVEAGSDYSVALVSSDPTDVRSPRFAIAEGE
ncbi:GPI anchored serine-threonine rich family protein [Nocardia concava]|uniref:GPI anchored serine-threonine rich family protein n=1 Tax=Nocardia concava TaxID=257281 RepID=UPI0002E231BE|nr:GPI anchored serine-threonine rich family protein [Nocardia concava]